MSSAVDGKAGLAEELRRRRTALGWTLEQVAAQAQVSVGMLSLIETGKRRPSLRSWERIRDALGISEPLPVELIHHQKREITDGLVASLGACLAAVRQATVAELAEVTGWPVSEIRLALRRLAEQLEPTGMQVLDDGSHVQLVPDRRFHGAVAQLVKPEQLPRLTQEQAEVLAIVISDGMATRRRIEEVRGRDAAVDRARRAGLTAPRQLGDAGAVALSRTDLCLSRRSRHWASSDLCAHTPAAATARCGNPRGGEAENGSTDPLPVWGGACLSRSHRPSPKPCRMEKHEWCCMRTKNEAN